jgi:hypothetical protein
LWQPLREEYRYSSIYVVFGIDKGFHQSHLCITNEKYSHVQRQNTCNSKNYYVGLATQIYFMVSGNGCFAPPPPGFSQLSSFIFPYYVVTGRAKGDAAGSNGEAVGNNSATVSDYTFSMLTNGATVSPYLLSMLPNSDGVSANGVKILPNGESVGANSVKILPNGESVGANSVKILPNGDGVSANSVKILPNGDGVSPNSVKILPDGQAVSTHGGDKTASFPQITTFLSKKA